VEASLHVQWDNYGTFCFVPTEDDCNAMLHELRTINASWQQVHIARNDQNTIRDLDVRFITFGFYYCFDFKFCL
jgi:hypothetical protein